MVERDGPLVKHSDQNLYMNIKLSIMADIFDEINEDLRKDRASELWSKYGIYVIAIVASIVLVVAGRQVFVGYQASQAAKSADAFYSAIQADDSDTALAALDLPDGYEMLAAFRQAASMAAGDDKSGASDAYLALSEDTGIGQIYRDIALLLSVQSAPASASVDGLTDRISNLAALAGPMQALALETLAGLYLRSGDISAAKDTLTRMSELTDISAPMRGRARQMLQVLGGEDN